MFGCFHIFQRAIIAACATAILLYSCAADSLPDDDCPVVSPCDCIVWWGRVFRDGQPNYVDGVDCMSRRLDRIPIFRNTSYKMSQVWFIQFQRNDISHIPDNAFSNLQGYGNGNNVYVLLDSNNLYTVNISDSAFSGIANNVVALSLGNNHLTSIPTAVSMLTNLQALNIHHNPVKLIDPSIFTSIYGTLRRFLLPVGDLPTWPTSLLQHLTALEYFSVDTRNGTIPDHAFVAFYDTLRELQIYCADWKVFPRDVCNLKRLERLEIRKSESQGQIYSHSLNGRRNMFPCTTPTNTTTVFFYDSNFYQFPNLLESFPYVELLYLRPSRIRFVDGSLIPATNRLRTFVCHSCNLFAIPGAITMLPFLNGLGLQDNRIKTVERLSFHGLRNLRNVDLRDNPIIYISRFAFQNHEWFLTLNLAGTKIKSIPQAVQNLTHLRHFFLENNKISCSCAQPWMKQWATSLSERQTSLTVYGNCKNSNETLSDFIFNRLPVCP